MDHERMASELARDHQAEIRAAAKRYARRKKVLHNSTSAISWIVAISAFIAGIALVVRVVLLYSF